MKRIISTLIAAALVAIAAATPAKANHEIGHFIAGLAVGAILGGTFAQHQRGGVHYGAPVYAPAPIIIVPAPRCHTRRGVVIDPWGQPRPAWIRECF